MVAVSVDVLEIQHNNFTKWTDAIPLRKSTAAELMNHSSGWVSLNYKSYINFVCMSVCESGR